MFGSGKRLSKAEKRKLKESKKKAKQLEKANKQAAKQKAAKSTSTKSKKSVGGKLSWKERRRIKKAEKKQKKQRQKQGKKKNEVIRVAEKEHVFADVRLFRYMPIIFMAACLLMAGGFGYMGWQNHEYKVAQGRLAMPNNTQLPLFKGQAKGVLTLKSVALSKNGKQMAASIGYDDDAHTQMSSFGKKYKLWVVAPNGYPIKDLKVKYGFFGTDGNAVLQVNSDKKLPNQAIVVIIVDAGHMVTQEDLAGSTDTDTSDSNIDQSITAQLATGSTTDSESGSTNANSSSSPNAKGSIPMYYVRLNPYSAKHTNVNWGDNERMMVDYLFVKHNLNHIRHQINANKSKLKAARETRKEYDQRLKINPQDKTAAEGKDGMDDEIKSLNQSIDSQEANYQRLSKARFSKHVLGSQQTKYHYILTQNMQYFANNGTQH